MSLARWLIIGSTACSPCPSGPPSLALGTGQTHFEPLTDGDPLDMLRGPQGGFHVFGSLQLTELVGGSGPIETDIPHVGFSLVTDEQEEVAAWATRPLWVPDGELIGQLVVFSHPVPPSLDGVGATFSAEVTDRCDSTASDAVSVVLQWGQAR